MRLASENEHIIHRCKFVLHKILQGIPIVNSQPRISLLVVRFRKTQSSIFLDFFFRHLSGNWIMSVPTHRTQSVPWTKSVARAWGHEVEVLAPEKYRLKDNQKTHNDWQGCCVSNFRGIWTVFSASSAEPLAHAISSKIF